MHQCLYFYAFSPGQVSSVFLKPLSETKIPVAWLDTVDLIAWNDGASFLLLICLNRWSALSARSRWCYGQLIPSSILSIDEVSILIISELAGGMVCHCCSHGFFSHLCPLLSSTTNCPPASNTALHAGNQTKNLKTSHPTQNSYCCVSRGESATKQMNPLTNDASIKYTVKKLDISVLSISSQSSVFNHMHRSRRLTSVPSRSQACPWTLTYYEVFNSFILMYLKCVFQCQMEGKR